MLEAFSKINNLELDTLPKIRASSASARKEDIAKCYKAGMEDFISRLVSKKDFGT